ncbi:unnamed protein product [Closterium sp. Yama58-4]|nr:unnamed protein product [Closterium sp. Yama58-4]
MPVVVAQMQNIFHVAPTTSKSTILSCSALPLSLTLVHFRVVRYFFIPIELSSCNESTRAVYRHRHSHGTAVGDGRDPHASQSTGASAGLMKLKSATKCLLIVSFPPLSSTPVTVHPAFSSSSSPCCSYVGSSLCCTASWMQGVGEAVRTVVASVVGTHELMEVMERRMRALGVQLEEAERRRAAEMREMRGQLGETEGQLKAANGEISAWKKIKSASQKVCLELHCHDGVSDAMLAHVSTMTHLTRITLDSSTGFSAEGIKHLYRLPRLKVLDLSCTYISDCALEGITSLTGLEQLYLHVNDVTDAGLSQLTCLSSLAELGLSGCTSVTDAGMVHVGRMMGLEELHLGWTAVTNDGLQQLSGLTNLTTLRIPSGELVSDENVLEWIGT